MQDRECVFDVSLSRKIDLASSAASLLVMRRLNIIIGRSIFPDSNPSIRVPGLLPLFPKRPENDGINDLQDLFAVSVMCADLSSTPRSPFCGRSTSFPNVGCD